MDALQVRDVKYKEILINALNKLNAAKMVLNAVTLDRNVNHMDVVTDSNVPLLMILHTKILVFQKTLV